MRDECLNEDWFVTLRDVRLAEEVWRIDYNEFRPHRSLGDLSPLQYKLFLHCIQASPAMPGVQYHRVMYLSRQCLNAHCSNFMKRYSADIT
ncbi:MAG: transposase [Dehalococcoidia bacterium]|nr:MAG: transposase [Dehalococcoidia bacterium]